METKGFDYKTKDLEYKYDNVVQIDDTDSARKFMANVFMWMFVALALSAACAYEFSVNEQLKDFLYAPENGILRLVVMFAPFAFVLAISFGLQKMSYPVLLILFVAFAAIMGISLSWILLVYTAGSVLGVFVTTSVVFGTMAIAGYTTDRDLTSMGSLLMAGLWGIIIASLVNMFLHSSGLNYIISYVGVAVFVGLTAYHVQKLKQLGASEDVDGTLKSKLGLVGALTLYLDFVNLFLMLLRLFGRRR
jgi:FtsH-binding integral membrane protein